MIDNKKLALIHIIKKELKLKDEDYRDILEKATGVRSAKDLNNTTFRKLMNHFVRSSHYRNAPNGMTLRQKMYIKTLSRHLEWTDTHLDNFIRKYYHESGLDALNKVEASKLIESLKHIQQHPRNDE